MGTTAPPTPTTQLHLRELAPECRAWVAGAQRLADERRHTESTLAHLCASALREGTSLSKALDRAAREALLERTEVALAAQPTASEESYVSRGLYQLLDALVKRDPPVSAADVVEALAGHEELAAWWTEAQIDVPALLAKLRAPAGQDGEAASPPAFHPHVYLRALAFDLDRRMRPETDDLARRGEEQVERLYGALDRELGGRGTAEVARVRDDLGVEVKLRDTTLLLEWSPASAVLSFRAVATRRGELTIERYRWNGATFVGERGGDLLTAIRAILIAAAEPSR
jgi:hypothetical protein